MEKIRIKLKNHSYMIVDCEDFGVLQEISEYFTFYVPGYKFMPSFRNKIWDGKIRMFNMMTKELNVGLYDKLKTFAKDRFYSIEKIDSDYGVPNSKNEPHTKEYIESLAKQLDTYSTEYKPRDYQFMAICHAIYDKRAILLSPTGSGKSFIIYNLLRWYLDKHDRNVLIVVPTTSLVEQMVSDFESYGFEVEKIVHKIYSGKDKDTKKRVIVSTWQSIYKLPTMWFKQFGCIFGDECHGFKSQSLSSIMNKSINAEYRFGTTGTLDGSQCFTGDMLVETNIGKKRIDEINTGDIVVSYNETTKEKEYKKVKNIFNNGISKEPLLKIRTKTGVIKCTKTHEIYTINRGWVEAQYLTTDDKILIN